MRSDVTSSWISVASRLRYFAFFEDVDLGWRLWLSGYKVRLAGGARVQRRHHATSSAIRSIGSPFSTSATRFRR